LFSRPFLKFKKPSTSRNSRGVDIQGTLIKRLLTVVTPTRPSNITSQSSVTSFQIVTRPLSPQAPTSTVDADSDLERPNWSISFNKKVKKVLDIGIEHDLYHEKPIWHAKFSHDGKYLAAGCKNGKAYIYDVQTGTLTS
jgi:WD40 repeat protein